MLRAFFFVLLTLWSTGPSQSSTRYASLVEIIANPSAFQGKVITVRGYLKFWDGEHNFVQLSLYKEDAENLLDNGVQVLPSKQMLHDKEKINEMYVELTGTVGVTLAAENGGSIVVIKDVQACARWSDPRHPKGTP